MKILLILSILLFLTNPAIAVEGEVILKNGNCFQGDIERLHDGGCWVVLGAGSIKFEEQEIKKIVVHSKPEPTKKKSFSSSSSLERISNSLETENRYDNLINLAAKKNDLDPALVKAVMKAESNFNYKVKSRKGACGLMQLMPETARKLGVRDFYSPEENVKAGARYLKDMIYIFDGDLEKALAAYNAGPNVVRKYKNVPPYRETKNYIQEVYRNYHQYHRSNKIYTFTDDSGCMNIYNIK